MAAEPEEEQVEKKKLPIVKILVMTLVSLLLVGVGVGGTVAFFILTKPPEDNPLAIVIEKKAGEGHYRVSVGEVADFDAGYVEAARLKTEKKIDIWVYKR